MFTKSNIIKCVLFKALNNVDGDFSRVLGFRLLLVKGL